ncbi:hypothetical protein BGP_0200 [Beggiatoa sp. PS]|nr:hypothetical protein BGP_0200 [Beggiatoa sp. PS]
MFDLIGIVTFSNAFDNNFIRWLYITHNLIPTSTYLFDSIISSPIFVIFVCCFENEERIPKTWKLWQRYYSMLKLLFND